MNYGPAKRNWLVYFACRKMFGFAQPGRQSVEEAEQTTSLSLVFNRPARLGPHLFCRLIDITNTHANMDTTNNNLATKHTQTHTQTCRSKCATKRSRHKASHFILFFSSPTGYRFSLLLCRSSCFSLNSDSFRAMNYGPLTF